MAVAGEHLIEHLTIHFEEAGDGWIVARIEEFPAAISQGRSHEEARVNLIAALHDLTDPHARPPALDRLRIAVAGFGRRLRIVG